MTTTTSYTVEGMTCGHCVQAVTEEVRQLAGVQEVVVDLAAGSLLVTSADPVPYAELRQAVEEAGYALSSS